MADTVGEIDLRRLKQLSRPEVGSLQRLAIDEVDVGKLQRILTITSTS